MKLDIRWVYLSSFACRSKFKTQFKSLEPWLKKEGKSFQLQQFLKKTFQLSSDQ